ncbi:MAG: hypothetical protein HYS66_04165 [Deltaproteobacteria bacterium]|nr:hypothetical protein [Deltaproteobacteria bacterium]
MLTKIVLIWFFVGLVGLNCRILEGGQSLDLKPEKNKLEVAIAATGPLNKLEVAIAATGPLYLPIFLANEAGYFAKRGVTVNLSVLSATASAQALLSGSG